MYTQTYVAGIHGGLCPDDREWWNAHIRASYRHARHMLRAARAHCHALRGLLAFGQTRGRVRAVKLEMEGLLFCLDAAQRAVYHARGLRHDRDRRFN